MTDLDDLRPEVRHEVECFDKCYVRGEHSPEWCNSWGIIRAELLRLAHDCDKFMWQVRDTCARAEKDEAELAALKARIAEAPITQVTRMAAIGGDGYEWAECRVPDTWNGKRVAMVLVEE